MSASVKLLCVPPSDVKKLWPHVRPLILEAALRGGGSFAEIKRGVLDGPDLLWLAWDGGKLLAAAITQIGSINDEKTCTIVACGGDGWSRFGHLIEGLEEFAIKEGCKAMRINGRIGWSRVLKDYDVQSVVLRKEL